MRPDALSSFKCTDGVEAPLPIANKYCVQALRNLINDSAFYDGSADQKRNVRALAKTASIRDRTTCMSLKAFLEAPHDAQQTGNALTWQFEGLVVTGPFAHNNDGSPCSLSVTEDDDIAAALESGRRPADSPYVPLTTFDLFCWYSVERLYKKLVGGECGELPGGVCGAGLFWFKVLLPALSKC